MKSSIPSAVVAGGWGILPGFAQGITGRLANMQVRHGEWAESNL